MPPKPRSTPRYTRWLSGELRMNLRLALVGENESDEHEIERADHDPAIRGRPARHRGDSEQQEANVLRDPGAARDDRTLPLRPGQLYRDRYRAAGERARQRGRPREEPRLPAHVVAIEPGRQAGPDRRASGNRCLLGKIELASLADREVEIRLADVVGGCRLIRVREDRGQRQQRSAPAPSRQVQTGAEMRVQADKPPRVRQTVEDAAHASRLAAQTRALASSSTAFTVARASIACSSVMTSGGLMRTSGL